MRDTGLEISGLSFYYYYQDYIFKDFNRSLPAGTLCRLQGPNGSGKTTLLELVARLLSPQAGTIAYPGACAFVPASIKFHEQLSVAEEVEYVLSAGSLDAAALDGSLRLWGLGPARRGTLMSELSTGWRQRFALALAFASTARVLLLDEPLENLDKQARALALAQTVKATDTGRVVLLADHSLPGGWRPPVARFEAITLQAREDEDDADDDSSAA